MVLVIVQENMTTNQNGNNRIYSNHVVRAYSIRATTTFSAVATLIMLTIMLPADGSQLPYMVTYEANIWNRSMNAVAV